MIKICCTMEKLSCSRRR